MKKLDLVKIPAAKVTTVSLEINDGINIRDWQKIGDTLRNVEGALQWWVGDWLNQGEQSFGEMYAQAVDHVGYAKKTLMNLMYVANRIPPSRRREKVSWSKHAEVASLDAEQQNKILAKAENMTVKQVRDVVKSVNEGKPIPEREICPECGRPL